MMLTSAAAPVLSVDAPGVVSGSQPLPLGSPLSLQVIGPTSDGRWNVAWNGRTLIAHSTVPLVLGATVEAIAARRGSVLELKVLPTGVRFDEMEYAAALLDQVRTASAGTAAPHLLLKQAIEHLAAGSRSDVGDGLPELAKQVANWLTPLRGDVPADALEHAIRQRLLSGGLLVARVFQALSTSRPSASGEMGPMLDALEAAAVHILSSQAETATHWLRGGDLNVTLPLSFGDDDTAVAHVRARGSRRGRSSSNAPFRFDVRVTLPCLGELELCVAWTPCDFAIRVYVASPAMEPLVRPELASLGAGLRRAGFMNVTTELAVDAHRFTTRPALPARTKSVGAVIDARV